MRANEPSTVYSSADDEKYIDPIERIMCHSCGRGDEEESMLLCDGCDDSYHTFCLLPPLSEIPKGDWRCPRCIAKEYHKPQEAFGFEQANKEYTLQSFGEMADQFKSDYFNMPVHMVPTATVEKEFWRIVSAINEDVTVEYGADLHTKDHGSGFPTKSSKALMSGDEEYMNSGWNLNVLPVLEGSVLSHINADISGMKIPWMYVGMCFATFCWHNEDHWSYSINYLHWGEPKTWYGVPGYKGAEFEEAMKAAAPELFEIQPDLLHQLVTIMNPNILMNAGVPVYRTNQCAGEFVVTFPRAYHAGFNQGYNFAEAVNFCPSDWLEHGRECISHYSLHNRFCVFSHDELVCKMASEPENLDLHLAAAVYQDMLRMVESEVKLRKTLLDKGVAKAEREAFELLPDDERQCRVCKTTCFLSAITCDCAIEAVCVKHVGNLCRCPPLEHCLRYRYTLDEMGIMLSQLKARAESFDNWSATVRKSLEPTEESRLELSEMKDLIKSAEDSKFPESDLLQSLKEAVTDAEKCGVTAQQLVSKKELIESIGQFQENTKKVLESSSVDSKSLEKLLDVGMPFDIDLPEIPSLKQKLEQVTWLEEVNDVLLDSGHVTVDVLRKLLDSGVNLPPNAEIEKSMAELQELLSKVERWEEKALICLQAKPRHLMETLEAIINEAQNITAHLPNTLALKDAVKKAKEWNSKLESLQHGGCLPYLEVMENLIHKGLLVPVRLDQLPQLELQITTAKAWRERTMRTFLKKNSTSFLIEVLSPRLDIGSNSTGKGRKRRLKDHSSADEKDKENHVVVDISSDTAKDPAAIVAAFKTAEKQEMEAMNKWRIHNIQKRTDDNGEARYCVCRKAFSGVMLQCELCKDYFHSSCVPIPKSSTLKNKSGQAVLSQMSRDIKFLCPLCLRSRRPRLETILSLLVSLQKLPLRMPEGEALQCLTERAMGWQDRARQALATEELSAALAKLSVFSQRMLEQAAREKTKKIINAELQKAAGNPELQSNLLTSGNSTVSSDIFLEVQPKLEEVAAGESCELGEVESQNSQSTEGVGHSPEQINPHDTDGPQGFSSSEHAYSTASKAAQGLSPRKHSRKSPLVPRQLEAPVLELSPPAKSHLEDLMMEGDILEVSLDETQHIWRILQACKPNKEETFPEFAECENEFPKKPSESTENHELGIVKSPLKFKRKKIDRKFPKKIKLGLQSGGSDLAEHKFSKERQLKKFMKQGKQKLLTKPLKIAFGSEGMSGGIGSKFSNLPFQVKKQVRKRLKKEKSDPSSIDGSSAGNDDPDDVCAAGKCLKPSGEVNWVQCDGGCELWFHLLCVGLNTGDVNENEDYICVACGSGKRARKMPGLHKSQEKQFGKRKQNCKVKRNLVRRITKAKRYNVKSITDMTETESTLITSESSEQNQPLLQTETLTTTKVKMESVDDPIADYDESEKVAIQSLSQLRGVGTFPSYFDSTNIETLNKVSS
ncbi:Lysine-specific demethylase 5B [Chamberlinius hualienensis]